MAVADGATPADRRMIGHLLASGWFEAIPASLLLLLAVVFNRSADHHPWQALALDAVICIAAALTGRYPRSASVALGALLALHLVIPIEWATMSEYAPLIPILGAGMRGQQRIQLAMIGGYGMLLVLITFRVAPDVAGALMGSLAWLVVLAITWLVGSAVATVAKAHQSQRIADMMLQRQRLTRELHDTVARSLTAVAKLGERIQRQGAASEEDLAALTDAARTAYDQLRLVMRLLNDPQDPSVSDPIGSSTLADALRAGRTLLGQHGFATTIAVEGDLELLSGPQSSGLGAAAGEAFANLIKHGDPSRPAAVVVWVSPARAELTFLNYPRADAPSTPAGSPLGLAGMRHRLTELGGTVRAEPVGSQWQTRIVLPLGAPSHDPMRLP